MKAPSFLRTRIGQRFLVLFLAVSLLPLATMGWFAVKSSEEALRRQTLSVLHAASDGAEAQVRELLRGFQERMAEVAGNERIRQLMEAVSNAGPTGNGSGEALELSKLL